MSAVEALSPELVGAQIDACVSDIGVDAVKIGMLGSPEIAAVVTDRLEDLGVPIVFDPVMVATSGAALADAETIAAFERLIALAALTTPNVAELAALGGHARCWRAGSPISPRVAMPRAKWLSDSLHRPGKPAQVWQASRIATRHTHGTGCTLASAIATELGRGALLAEAIERGRAFVRAALLAAPGFGAGHGPLGHAAVGH